MTKYIEDMKELLSKELETLAKKGDISVNTLEKIHMLTDTIKNIDKIEMYEEYQQDGASFDSDYSQRRGRGSNAKRDSMGRYANDNEYAEDGSSYGYIPNYGYTRDRYPNERYMRDGYSRDEHDSKEMMMSQLKEMMNQAESSKEREAIQRCISAIKNA